jgi:hypothetical protein
VPSALFVEYVDDFGLIGVDFIGRYSYKEAIALVIPMNTLRQIPSEFMVETIEICIFNPFLLSRVCIQRGVGAGSPV